MYSYTVLIKNAIFGQYFAPYNNEEEDLKRRISHASQAYGRMYSLWLRRQIVPAAIRLRLYNAIVLPTLLHNCETWDLPISVLTRLDTFHRRQLRALLGIRYPAIISNKDLYLRTKSRPLKEIVHHRRLRMAGHVPRMEPSTPPQLPMWNYYQKDVRRSQGRPKTTLAMSVSSTTGIETGDDKRSEGMQEAG